MITKAGKDNLAGDECTTILQHFRNKYQNVFCLVQHKLLMDERNILFNDILNTFMLRLYGVGLVLKDHAHNERGNPMSPIHGLVFPISR